MDFFFSCRVQLFIECDTKEVLSRRPKPISSLDSILSLLPLFSSAGAGAAPPAGAGPPAPTLQMRLPMLTLARALQTGLARKVPHLHGLL